MRNWIFEKRNYKKKINLKDKIHYKYNIKYGINEKRTSINMNEATIRPE